MSDFLYHIIVIGFAVLAILRGFRLGMVRQISAALGMAFGIVAARVFAPSIEDTVVSFIPGFLNSFNAPFLVATISYGIIFGAVYTVVKLLTGIINFAMRILSSGMFNSIVGSIFCLFKYMMFISLTYNFIADINPSDSSLLKFERQHDGNVIEGVMWVAPAVLGFPGADELNHALQLEKAKEISQAMFNLKSLISRYVCENEKPAPAPCSPCGFNFSC